MSGSQQSKRWINGAGAAGAATALVVGLSAAPASASSVSPLTLSSVTGPSGGGNSLTATTSVAATAAGPFPAGSIPTVQFQYIGVGSTLCTPSARAVTQIANTNAATTAGALTVDPNYVKRLASNKIAFTVPAVSYPANNDDGSTSTINTAGLTLGTGQNTSKWSVCVYDTPATTGGTLLASTTYTIAVRPKITAIIPSSSPAIGGQAITVTGVGFSTAASATTATVGNAALTAIKVASNGNSLTAVTPSRAPGTGLALVVNTLGGQVSSFDPDNNGMPQDSDPTTPDAPIPFTFSNGLQISPDTAPAGSKVDIDVKGVGFSSLTFSDTGTPTDGKAHVFLVRGAYSAASNRGLQECKEVMIVSNTELLCTLDLGADKLNPADSSQSSGPVPEDTYTLTVVASGDPTATDDVVNASIVSSGSTFTVSPY